MVRFQKQGWKPNTISQRVYVYIFKKQKKQTNKEEYTLMTGQSV